MTNPIISDEVLEELIAVVKELAPQLPTGIIDPNVMSKLTSERQELLDAIQAIARSTSDTIGEHIGNILSEVADCAYYAVKAGINEHIPPERVRKILSDIMTEANTVDDLGPYRVQPHRLSHMIRAKYEHRIAHGKSDIGKQRENARLILSLVDFSQDSTH